jgi:hypothetical protein
MTERIQSQRLSGSPAQAEMVWTFFFFFLFLFFPIPPSSLILFPPLSTTLSCAEPSVWGGKGMTLYPAPSVHVV